MSRVLRVVQWIDRSLRWIILGLISVYQKTVSPLLSATKLNPSEPHSVKHCKFCPSCSDYSAQCFQKYWVGKALAKTIWRVARCHPWAKGGVDEA